MGINDRMVFQTPGKDRMTVDKGQPTGQTCPACGGADVRRYPIGWYKGPRMVTKCQACFHSLAVERPALEDNWPPFRSATYDWQPSASERASLPGA
jgi:ssDNA-binding Zn-finger/Zn-ribbon topoisomerase 1